MGGPPWEQPERYVANSPVFHADRIETPTLIVHGDLDHVGIESAEEMFTALYRLGRPARFVRYWGESHVVQSPGNVRDMWSEVLSWLGRWLR